MLGERLLSSGTITAAQLQIALEEQRTTGGLLGEILMKFSFIGEEALSKALAQEAGVPFVSINGTRPDPSLVALVPESFARQHLLVPLRFQDAVIEVLQANPFDVLAIDELQRVAGHPAQVMCGTRSDVLRLIDRSYGRRRAMTEAPNEGADIERLVDSLLDDAIARGATELHIEPEEKLIRLRYRVDGVLVAGDELPIELRPPLVRHIKTMAGLDPAEEHLPQDGRFSHETNGRTVGLRISSLPTMYGETIAVRILERSRLIRGLEDLGFGRRNLALFRDILTKPRGLVLVTGPTGAGKTTTLYSALAYLGGPAVLGTPPRHPNAGTALGAPPRHPNAGAALGTPLRHPNAGAALGTPLDGREKNILTVEDPIECEIQGIRQTQVRPRAGFTLATAIQSLLRHDPDVIMIDEICDLETAQVTLRAALSGVVVFSTLPTVDSASALRRLIDLGLEPYLVASGLLAVIAQRLVRVICSECKAPASYTADILSKIGLAPDPGFLLYRGQGCERCGGTGYRGRTGIFEILVMDAGVQALVRERADVTVIQSAAAKAGMKTLWEDALSKAILGQTTIEEVLRVNT